MTPEQLVQLTEDINDRVYNLVKDKLVPGIVVPGERVPIVFDRLVVDADHRAWANMLRSDRHFENPGDEVGQVHAFMVYPKGIRDYVDKTVRSMPWQLDFAVDSFYQDYPGKTHDNPGFRHNKELILVAATLWSARPFGVVGVKQVVNYREVRTLTRIGDVMVRQAMATVTIKLQPAEIP